MVYFNNVLTAFLDFESCNDFAAYVWFRNLTYFIKNILICVPKWTKVSS